MKIYVKELVTNSLNMAFIVLLHLNKVQQQHTSIEFTKGIKQFPQNNCGYDSSNITREMFVQLILYFPVMY